MSEEKEPHYFSYVGERRPTWGVQTLEAYGALFDGVRDESAIGEASTWMLYSETAAREIRALTPDARILILLRDPVERAYSGWAYQVQMRWEKERFEDALALEPSRVAQGRSWDVHYVGAGMYADQVRRYLDVFPRDQVRVWSFEEFKRDPSRVTREAYVFVGVDPDANVPDTGTAHNATALPRWPVLSRVLRRRGRVRSVAKSVVPTVLRQQIGRAVRSWNQMPRPPMDPVTRARLRDVYREDVRNLSQLLGRDFMGEWFGPALPPSE